MDDLNNVNDNKNNQTPSSNVADEFATQDLEVSWLRWKCLNCGYVYEGAEPIRQCPRCGNNDPDKFDDVD